MSIGKILSRIISTTPKELKRVAATKDVISRKVSIGGSCGPEKMINCPAADEFIKSAYKQNADIISDNIVKMGYSYYRVITKRLQSGTTVAKAYGASGVETLKEVIGRKTGITARSRIIGSAKTVYVQDYQKGKGYYKPFYCSAKEVIPLPNNIPVNDSVDLSRVTGITEFSNAKNQNYLDLKRMEMIR